jgi:hypothetical protein
VGRPPVSEEEGLATLGSAPRTSRTRATRRSKDRWTLMAPGRGADERSRRVRARTLAIEREGRPTLWRCAASEGEREIWRSVSLSCRRA